MTSPDVDVGYMILVTGSGYGIPNAVMLLDLKNIGIYPSELHCYHVRKAEICVFSYPFPVTGRHRMTSPEVNVGWMGTWRNEINLVTIKSKGVNHLWEQVHPCCVCFEDAGVTAAVSKMPVQKSTRVQPEMNIVYVKPEVLVPEIKVEICVKFERDPHILWVEQQGGTLVSTVRCPGV